MDMLLLRQCHLMSLGMVVYWYLSGSAPLPNIGFSSSGTVGINNNGGTIAFTSMARGLSLFLQRHYWLDIITCASLTGGVTNCIAAVEHREPTRFSGSPSFQTRNRVSVTS